MRMFKTRTEFFSNFYSLSTRHFDSVSLSLSNNNNVLRIQDFTNSFLRVTVTYIRIFYPFLAQTL
jgi:hypothetical protein